MNNFRSLFAVSIATVLSLSIAHTVAHADELEAGKAVPDFELTDTAGKTVKLSDFKAGKGKKGSFVVLEWLNFDCPFVKKHYDAGNMQKTQAEAKAKKVVWLSIISGSKGMYPAGELNKMKTTQKGEQTAILLDPTGKVAKAYGAKTTPHMFVIDNRGTLVYSGAIDSIASKDEEDIAKAKNLVTASLNEALVGKKVTTSYQKPYGCSISVD